jgi:L-idonate 5-dehydrogenase
MLGHEFAGKIIELGSQVFNLKVGDRVIVNPALTCNECSYCKSNKNNLCENGSFFGSAAKFPHTQGAFREHIEIYQSQCHKIEQNISFEEAAFAEPLAVALHATSLINNYKNKKIIISGCGPIGLLILKILINLTELENVFVIDVNDNVLKAAKNIGIINSINIITDNDFLKDRSNFFDIAFEASGNVNSINNIINLLSKSGQVIQVGNMPGGLIGIEYNKLMLKELNFIGSYRFNSEFNEAVKAINKKIFDFSDMLTHKFNLKNCDEAMKVAANKDLSIKVQVFT